VIACEFVSIFAALGVQVSVVDSHAQLLEYLSGEVVEVLADTFCSMGVNFYMQQRIASIQLVGNGALTTLESGQQISSDAVLYAQGREPNIEKLNTQNAGIELDAGWIKVNPFFQTSVPHILQSVI